MNKSLLYTQATSRYGVQNLSQRRVQGKQRSVIVVYFQVA